jgi:Chaperone for flagella basal body P-ring formation
MAMKLGSKDRALLGWIAALGFAGLMATGLAHADCAASAVGAAAVGLGGKSALRGDGVGFRVRSVRWDPVLRQGWALVVSCDHPEWPAVELPAPLARPKVATAGWEEQGQGQPAAALAVRAGEAVRLWHRESDMAIDLAAIAEENGAVGKTVRVRVVLRSEFGQRTEEELTGVVRGPREVELVR